MSYHIQVTRTEQSNLAQLDFNHIPFGKVFSDHMFVADYYDGQWNDLRIIPFEAFSMHPANMTLHYSQTIFEGMKASKNRQDVPLLLSPEKHAQRLNASAKRICMPTIPEALFLQALQELIGLDHKWIPPSKGSSLYIRPYMFATDNLIKWEISDTYRFVIFTCPVNVYYDKPVSLVTEQKFVRAVNGSTGEAKAGINYAASLLPTKLAKQKGYDQIIWLESPEFKKIQEAGTMNLFFVIGDTVVTPPTSGAILQGITRMNFLEVLKRKGIKTEVRDIYIDELIAAYQTGQLKEVFGAGTAAVVTHASALTHNDLLMTLPPMSERKIGNLLKAEMDGIRAGTIEDVYGWLLPVDVPIAA